MRAAGHAGYTSSFCSPEEASSCHSQRQPRGRATRRGRRLVRVPGAAGPVALALPDVGGRRAGEQLGAFGLDARLLGRRRRAVGRGRGARRRRGGAALGWGLLALALNAPVLL